MLMMFPLKTYSLTLKPQLCSITLSSKMYNEKSKPYVIYSLWKRPYNPLVSCCWFASGDPTKAAKAWGKAGLSATARFCATTSRASLSYPPPGSSWWCEAHLWAHLQGDPRGPESASGERDPGRSHLHRARQAEDWHRQGCGLRSQAPGPYPLQFRQLSFPICPQELDFFAANLHPLFTSPARRGCTTSNLIWHWGNLLKSHRSPRGSQGNPSQVVMGNKFSIWPWANQVQRWDVSPKITANGRGICPGARR